MLRVVGVERRAEARPEPNSPFPLSFLFISFFSRRHSFVAPLTPLVSPVPPKRNGPEEKGRAPEKDVSPYSSPPFPSFSQLLLATTAEGTAREDRASLGRFHRTQANDAKLRSDPFRLLPRRGAARRPPAVPAPARASLAPVCGQDARRATRRRPAGATPGVLGGRA